MTEYESFINRKKIEYPETFDDCNLSKQFIPYYNSGQRIEVNVGGEIKRGTIGITTGWKPCFLLMLTKRSTGSCYTLSDSHKILKVIR